MPLEYRLERVSQQFHEAASVDDWQVLFKDTDEQFRTESFTAGVLFV